MSALTIFAFEGFAVRVAGTSEKPEWVAADVCKVLGLSNITEALRSLKDSERGSVILNTPGGRQEMMTVTEPGLYRLIFKSRKEAAERFKDWVFHEVLPSIRKTGSYSIELELAKAQKDAAIAQQKLLSSVQMLETISPGLAPLALGRADAVVERVEVVERHAVVDQRGRVQSLTEGKSKTALAKELGFKKPADFVAWLESLGRKDLLEEGVMVVKCEYVPYSRIAEIKRLWSQKQGTRQKLVGEAG